MKLLVPAFVLFSGIADPVLSDGTFDVLAEVARYGYYIWDHNTFRDCLLPIFLDNLNASFQPTSTL